ERTLGLLAEGNIQLPSHQLRAVQAGLGQSRVDAHTCLPGQGRDGGYLPVGSGQGYGFLQQSMLLLGVEGEAEIGDATAEDAHGYSGGSLIPGAPRWCR